MKAKTNEKELLITKINSLIWYLADGAPSRSFADINSAYEMIKIELMIFSHTENCPLILEKTNALPALSPLDFNQRNSLAAGIQTPANYMINDNFISGILARISSDLQAILFVIENHKPEKLHHQA